MDDDTIDDESDLPCCDFPSVHVLWMGGFRSQPALFMKTISRHLSDIVFKFALSTLIRYLSSEMSNFLEVLHKAIRIEYCGSKLHQTTDQLYFACQSLRYF